MGTIVVGYVPKPEGKAALRRAAEQGVADVTVDRSEDNDSSRIAAAHDAHVLLAEEVAIARRAG